jgi:ABC-2 type transport system permease protein
MIAALRSELRKLHTVRAPWLILGAALLVVVAGVSGLVASGADLKNPAMQSAAAAHLALVALFSLVFGILSVAGEYRQRTITDTFLSSPKRGQVVHAKLLVYTAIGLGTGVVGGALAILTASLWWGAKGAAFDLGDTDMWNTIIGGVVANALYAAIGVGIGTLVRNLTAALLIAVGWIAVVEGIVGQLIGTELAKWLPFTAGRALALAEGSLNTGLLERGIGGIVVAAYAIVFASIAVFSTLKRDVT